MARDYTWDEEVGAEAGPTDPDAEPADSGRGDPFLWWAFGTGLAFLAFESFFGVLLVLAILNGEDPIVGLGLLWGLPFALVPIVLFAVGMLRGGGRRARAAGAIGLLLALLSCPSWYLMGILAELL
jgi:hypothetical protein